MEETVLCQSSTPKSVTLEQRSGIRSDCFSRSAQWCCHVTSSPEFLYLKYQALERRNTPRNPWAACDPRVSMSAGHHTKATQVGGNFPSNSTLSVLIPCSCFCFSLGLFLTGLLTFYSIAGILQRGLLTVPACSMAHHGPTTSWPPASAFIDSFIFPGFLNSQFEERIKRCSSSCLCCPTNDRS